MPCRRSFFGIKSYRDNHQEGAITFGKGFLVGLLIALLASTFYVVAWEIYFNATDQRFAEQYYSQTVTDIRDSGLPQPEVDAKVKKMEDMRDLYVNNALFRLAITYMEILPVGLLISLISAAVLRRKEVLPA
ncbi:MAG: DUF4199 domain-containing protein [Bacteroidia bacterium]|nr:DUF4199 domain-containing protein [Bacteroidia bacterium]